MSISRAALFLVLLAWSTLLHGQEFSRRTSASQYGVERPVSMTLVPASDSGPGIVLAREVRQPNTSLLRIHFKVIRGEAEQGWRVEVYGPRGLVSTDRPAGRSSFWSGEVPADRATVRIVFDRPGPDVALEVDKVLVSVKVPSPQGIITSRADIHPIATENAEVRALARAVARLQVVNTGAGDYCTGFLVGPDLLLTNEHCMPTSEVALSALVDFDYDNSLLEPKQVRVAALISSSYELDYALVRLDRTPVGIAPLTLFPTTLSKGDELLLVQHPNGEPKQVARIGCKVIVPETDGRGDATDFAHLCNTLGGSSGSPILDRSRGVVVGLHHLGFLPGTVEPQNRGVKLGLILDHIKARDATAHAQLRVELAEVFDGSVPIPLAALVRVVSYGESSFSGTGFAVGSNGLIATAASLVENARAIHVFSRGSGTSRAELLSVSRETGIAIIRADDLNPPPLQLARRQALVGDRVTVVGFDGNRVALIKDEGIVQLVGRREIDYSRSRSSTPGIAGAPVFLRSGEVVGMHLNPRQSERDPAAIAVPVSTLRAELADVRLKFAFPEESSRLVAKKWRTFFQLTCDQVLDEPVRATIPLREGETLEDVSAEFENAEAVIIGRPPMATSAGRGLQTGTATVRFELKGLPKSESVSCSTEGRATLVVTFLVRPPSPAKSR